MNRKWLALLACAAILCAAAAGCAKRETDVPHDPSPVVTDPDEGEPGSGVVRPGEDSVNAAGEPVKIDDVGKVRISYTGNRSSVVYVTSASQLPDQEELKKYDDAYFEEHALVLVTETMTSGSVEVGIASVNVSGGVGTVTLYHGEPEQGTYNTSDMATWLLWAEVEPGLDCRWVVANPAVEPDTQTH